MKKLLCIVLLVSLNQLNAQVCFSPSTQYPNNTVSSEFALCTTDFNGDGKLDLAVADDKVTLWMGTGNGNFLKLNSYAVGTSPECIISADFNKDGKPDYAVANSASNSISVLLGDGTGNTMLSIVSYNTASGTKALTSGDFNGDGHLDLAVATSYSVAILMGSKAGDGTFGQATNYSIGGNTPYSICSADFNNDGKQDLATVNVGTDNLSVLIGNGDSTFKSPNVMNGINEPYSLCATDFDKDGNIDLAIVASGLTPSPGELMIFKNLGSGNFASVQSIPIGHNGTSVSAADYNGDGSTDLAVSDFDEDNVYIALNAGTTASYTFQATALTVPVASIVKSSRWIVHGDFDGNGSPDLALANDASQYSFSILLNNAPFLKITGTDTICKGGSTILTASGASGYTWSGSQTTATISATPTATTSYTVTGGNSGCAIANSATVSVLVNNLPTVNATATSTLICSGRSVTLNGAGTSTSYSWTNGVANGIAFTPTASATYTVTGTDINHCTNTAVIPVNLSSPVIPSICMVTTDSASGYNYNIIHWTNTDYPAADSFIVYRDIAGIYTRLGAVAKDSSHFTDIYRNIGGPNGGDPNNTAYHYSLAIRDSCGNLSAQSVDHQTTNVYLNGTTNIDWNDYTIGGVAVLGYDVYWDSLGVDNFVLHQSGLTSTQTNIPSFSQYPNQVFRIDPILSYTCNVNQRQVNPNNSLTIRQKSHSNSTKRTGQTTGINQVTGNKYYQVSIYPNPNNGIFVLETNASAKQTLQLFDVNGNLVLTQIISGRSVIDASGLSEGLYNLNLISNNALINKRIVIVK